MARQKKAPEFQCNIKYKNDLPLPPVSAVLLDVSLSVPKETIQAVLRNESTAYAPTTLERGMRNFTLPAELLKFSVFNTVDLELLKQPAQLKMTAGQCSEDKDILMPIEELELKLKSSTAGPHEIVTPTNEIPKPLKSSFARPDVTWLRRTEYISSVRNTPTLTGSSANALSADDAKALLADPVNFPQILKEVDETFHPTCPNSHPMKPTVNLLQSFPINFCDEKRLFNTHSFAHCLFLGDNAGTENSILKVDSEHVVTLFNNKSDSLGNSIFKSCGDFDIQRSLNKDSGKSFVIMLPRDQSPALLTKINSNFSLRKRRNGKGRAKNGSKIIKIVRE